MFGYAAYRHYKTTDNSQTTATRKPSSQSTSLSNQKYYPETLKFLQQTSSVDESKTILQRIVAHEITNEDDNDLFQLNDEFSFQQYKKTIQSQLKSKELFDNVSQYLIDNLDTKSLYKLTTLLISQEIKTPSGNGESFRAASLAKSLMANQLKTDVENFPNMPLVISLYAKRWLEKEIDKKASGSTILANVRKTFAETLKKVVYSQESVIRSSLSLGTTDKSKIVENPEKKPKDEENLQKLLTTLDNIKLTEQETILLKIFDCFNVFKKLKLVDETTFNLLNANCQKLFIDIYNQIPDSSSDPVMLDKVKKIVPLIKKLLDSISFISISNSLSPEIIKNMDELYGYFLTPDKNAPSENSGLLGNLLFSTTNDNVNVQDFQKRLNDSGDKNFVEFVKIIFGDKFFDLSKREEHQYTK